jgi:hypothetical protein
MVNIKLVLNCGITSNQFFVDFELKITTFFKPLPKKLTFYQKIKTLENKNKKLKKMEEKHRETTLYVCV